MCEGELPHEELEAGRGPLHGMDDKHFRRGADVLADGAMPVPRKEQVLAGHGTQGGQRNVPTRR
eukprot:1842027-Prorocentrum_lima.AAC.1